MGRYVAYGGFALILTMLIAGCKTLPPPIPLNQLNAQQTRGYYVFQRTCRTCHSDRVSQPLYGPALRGVFKKKYLPSGAPANDDRVTATIVNGYGVMPAQGRNLSQQDLDDVIAYLHTL
ncbi:MAG TPA: cytochrome c [Acidobacteriaceae bacterium]|nr:cytochrome c [Acidobacteriaceae bacterium]